MGMELFFEQLHGDLKSGRYKPSPSRRKLIPKPRQPGKFRPLGIPTVHGLEDWTHATLRWLRQWITSFLSLEITKP